MNGKASIPKDLTCTVLAVLLIITPTNVMASTRISPVGKLLFGLGAATVVVGSLALIVLRKKNPHLADRDKPKTDERSLLLHIAKIWKYRLPGNMYLHLSRKEAELLENECSLATKIIKSEHEEWKEDVFESRAEEWIMDSILRYASANRGMETRLNWKQAKSITRQEHEGKW